MKRLSRVLFTALFVFALGGHAFAELKVKTVGSEGGKPEVTKERFLKAVATVEAIDLKTRIVTLKGDGGRIFDVKVGPEAKNLPQVKTGDQVTVKYYQAVSAKVYKAGEAPQLAERSAKLETAKEGEKPGGRLAVQSTVTAAVESIDAKKPEVTLKTTEGKWLTVKIEEPKLLENVKVGDQVVITYSEAMAISVEKMKAQGKK